MSYLVIRKHACLFIYSYRLDPGSWLDIVGFFRVRKKTLVHFPLDEHQNRGLMCCIWCCLRVKKPFFLHGQKFENVYIGQIPTFFSFWHCLSFVVFSGFPHIKGLVPFQLSWASGSLVLNFCHSQTSEPLHRRGCWTIVGLESARKSLAKWYRPTKSRQVRDSVRNALFIVPKVLRALAKLSFNNGINLFDLKVTIH